MGDRGESGKVSPPTKVLLEHCAELRDEIAKIVQESRDARRRFKKRVGVSLVKPNSNRNSRATEPKRG